MLDFVTSPPLFLAFIGASVLLALTPGPGVLYIVARSLAQGRDHGLVSVAGVAVGNLGNALAATLGLAALFAASSLAFTVVKYAGAAYLIYLGIQALRRAPEQGGLPRVDRPEERRSSLRRVWRDGFWVALLNPKTTIFFAAFLPQFMVPGGDPMVQGLVLGVVFVVIAALTDSLYAIGAGAVAPWLSRRDGPARFGKWLSGGTFIGLGLLTAGTGARVAD